MADKLIWVPTTFFERQVVERPPPLPASVTAEVQAAKRLQHNANERARRAQSVADSLKRDAEFKKETIDMLCRGVLAEVQEEGCSVDGESVRDLIEEIQAAL
jgi:hypothetical protein